MRGPEEEVARTRNIVKHSNFVSPLTETLHGESHNKTVILAFIPQRPIQTYNIRIRLIPLTHSTANNRVGFPIVCRKLTAAIKFLER